ncbi:ABC-type transport auxiliary lipoprotein family protein [Ectothiorhodospira lacustris]|uniref:ABC-type transport auxiliary lipoprotein family protein n=2 Tax=Ectothiorhodospira lacustris TaxID=2899127 RepID=UPI001EE987E1|nr:ABC-type transport auxiliary lipoprotein family protein [Ectothiorhodospira lacustris]MCG5509968.1 PqiC family protein [Ectothiorhodospira lacustris]MCG5521714.1 PqiC family protein [Ectothiorhodospira lacustris]
MPQVPKILLMLMLVPALFTIGACSVSLERDPPVRMTYLMEAKRPALQPSGPAVGSLAMGTVRVAPEFSTRGLIYRMDDTRYVSDFHHDWFAPVRDQVYSAARDWLHEARVFQTILPPSLAREADYRLDILVNTVYGDLRDAQSPTAVLEIQAYLSSRAQAGERRIPLASTLQSRQPLSEATPAQVATGLSRGLADILGQLEMEIMQALP